MKRIIVAITLMVSSALVHAASFDCAKASTKIENAICGDEQLSKFDSDLLTAYKAAQTNSADPDKLKSEQRAWLQTTRNKCENAECLKTAYINRIGSLESGSNAKAADISYAKDEPANIPNENPSEAKPSEKIEAPFAPMAQSPELTQGSSTTFDHTASAQKAEQATGEPSSPVADVLFGAAGLISIALLAGLIRPKWIIRWSEKPTRVKVVGYLIPLLLVVSLAAPISRTKSRQEYDMKVATDTKAKAETDAQEKAMRQQQVATQRKATGTPLPNTSAPAQQADTLTADSNPSAVNYRRATREFLRLIEAAPKTSTFNDPYNPACKTIVNSSYDTFNGQIRNSIADMTRSGNREMVYASMESAAMTLNGLSGQLSAVCGIR